jgi:hypothetical protein
MKGQFRIDHVGNPKSADDVQGVKAMQTGRAEPRIATNAVANLETVEEPSISETVVFANISEHGARLITGRYWPTGARVVVSDALVNFQTEAEVVYCAPHTPLQYAVGPRLFAVGLKFSGPLALAAHGGELRAIIS